MCVMVRAAEIKSEAWVQTLVLRLSRSLGVLLCKMGTVAASPFWGSGREGALFTCGEMSSAAGGQTGSAAASCPCQRGPFHFCPFLLCTVALSVLGNPRAFKPRSMIPYLWWTQSHQNPEHFLWGPLWDAVRFR